jgi:hypothetical protein
VEAYQTSDNQLSLAATVGKIVDDTHTLVRQEIELVKTEVKQEVKRGLKISAGLVVGAGAAAFGAVILTVAIVEGLRSAGLSLGLSCLIVAVAYFGIALGAFAWAKKKAEELGSSFVEGSRSGTYSGSIQQENVRWLKNQA